MTLQEQIIADMRSLMTSGKDTPKLNALRYIVGEFSREPAKDVPDATVIKIIRRVVEAERSLKDSSHQFIASLECYLPADASDDEVKKWIKENIDFSQFKNRMQAMKPIMAAFVGRIDGNRVKALLGDV